MGTSEKKVPKSGSKVRPERATWRITAIYLISGTLWIGFSDQIASWMVTDKDVFARVSLIKGWFFVAMTTALLFFLIYRVTRRMGATERRLQEQNEELLESREKLRHLAYRDPLTGLPNRHALYDGLSDLAGVALFLIDLDDFKYVNDTTNHVFGDRLIVEISERLRQALSADRDGRLYRIGGDEWIVVTRSPREMIAFDAAKLLGAFEQPFVIGDRRLHMNASIGIAQYPVHGRTLEQLMRNADIAMYEAKKQGKNNSLVYDPSHDVPIQHRAAMERLMRRALDSGEFELAYQPQVRLQDGCVAGFEALLRWNSTELGIVLPEQFIRIAEETQLILPIGDWVLRQACEFARSLPADISPRPIVSVNVSVVQLVSDRFVEQVLEVLQEAGVDPSHMELEITETTMIESIGRIGDKLRTLKEHGLHIALDDFGRGYSSLSHLLKLPITTLKIDKSFIDQVPEQEMERPLAGLIIQLTRRMGLKVIAEGVEEYAQLDYLKKHECDCVQGYLFSMPLSPGEARSWLRTMSPASPAGT